MKEFFPEGEIIMLTRTYACGLEGIHGFPVEAEAFLTKGLVNFDIVGLPSAAVKESRERIRAAIAVSGYDFPMGHITVNLAPADVKKEGTGFDLPIAIALMAMKDTRIGGLEDTMLVGELSMQGKILPIHGALAMAITAAEHGIANLILPAENAQECECVENLHIYPAETLAEVCEHLCGTAPLPELPHKTYQQLVGQQSVRYDLKYVKGQRLARKALEIAAAGGHNMLMVGIPGSGKTMLARCLPDILPPLGYEEALETTLIHSAAGELPVNQGLMVTRPYRSPHHTISMPAMIGGGSKARPGEISLAHNGVLFLDELPEFQRATLEALRQPLEDGVVHIDRIGGKNQYQSRCMFVASMNPCPCGYAGSRKKECRCTGNEIKRYLDRISGPLLDRIDLQVEMDAVTLEEIENAAEEEDTATVRARVLRAREIQQERYQEKSYFCNAQLDQEGIEQFCALDAATMEIVHRAMDTFNLSMRTYSRLRKVARTIADLAGREDIQKQDMVQAIQYRNVNSKYWK